MTINYNLHNKLYQKQLNICCTFIFFTFIYFFLLIILIDFFFFKTFKIFHWRPPDTSASGECLSHLILKSALAKAHFLHL